MPATWSISFALYCHYNFTDENDRPIPHRGPYQQSSSTFQDMAVRGAPAIAIAAALALAVELVNGGGGAQFSSAQAAYIHITEQLDYLVTRCR